MSNVKIYDGEKFVNFNISNGIELPVGFEYYVPYSELDSGQLIRDGQIVSRSVYKDLWDFVQKHPSLLLTEEQWQAELSANEGIVNNYYSSGDGSTTFRLPKAGVIELPVITAEGLNKFSTDSFKSHNHENITEPISGKILNPIYWNTTDNGGMLNNANIKSQNSGSLAPYFAPLSGTNITNVGGTETKPKTITKLAVVQAFGRIINTGTLDINDLVNDVNNLIQSNHIKSYTDLSQIGITKGTETLKAIGKALPDNSMLIYSIYPQSGHNNVEYPYVSGQFRLIKSKYHCSLYFQTDFGRSYEKYFDDRDSYYVENSWKKIADKDKLNAPDLANKSELSISWGSSYTAPCDGYFFGYKIGNTHAGTYLAIYDSPDSEDTTMKTTVFYDYGNDFPYIGGTMPASKGQTYYFFSEGSLKVYFVPSKSANYTLYGEDFRIYIKVTDANGSILKGANVKILSSDDTQIVSGTTYGDGRFFIPIDKLQELFNYISYTIEVTYGSITKSLTYMRNQIDKEAINDITVSLSSLSELKIINTIDGETTTSTEIGYTIRDSTQTNTVVEEVFSNTSGINIWENLILDPGTYYIINTSVPDGVSFSLDFIELIVTSSDSINKQFSVNLSNVFPLP